MRLCAEHWVNMERTRFDMGRFVAGLSTLLTGILLLERTVTKIVLDLHSHWRFGKERGKHLMNWLTLLVGITKLVPYVVYGIETIHANESTETKTQLAQDALSVAVAGATASLPSNSDAQLAQAIGSTVNQQITLAQQIIAASKMTQSQAVQKLS